MLHSRVSGLWSPPRHNPTRSNLIQPAPNFQGVRPAADKPVRHASAAWWEGHEHRTVRRTPRGTPLYQPAQAHLQYMRHAGVPLPAGKGPPQEKFVLTDSLDR